MIELNESNFDQQIAKGIVVVDFTAEWCPPCRMLKPVLERVRQILGEQFTFAQADADHNQQLLTRYRISALPTIVAFSDGQPVRTLRGLRDEKTLLVELREIIAATGRTPVPSMQVRSH
jgi:thioredoxin 1